MRVILFRVTLRFNKLHLSIFANPDDYNKYVSMENLQKLLALTISFNTYVPTLVV